MKTKEDNKLFLVMLIQSIYMLSIIDKIHDNFPVKQRLRWGLRIVEQELMKLDVHLEALCKAADKDQLYAAMDGQRAAIEFVAGLTVEQLLEVAANGINPIIEKKGDMV